MKHQPVVEFKAQAVVFRALMTMFNRAKENEEDIDPYEVLPIAVFMAFTIEAYVNSIGSKRVPLWKHLERSPWRKKIEILHEVSGRDADWTKPPLTTAVNIFSLRDRLAHGKPETVPGPITDCPDKARAMLYVQEIKPPILNGLNRVWVLDSGEQLYELLEYIARLFGLEPDDFAGFSWGYVKQHSPVDGRKV